MTINNRLATYGTLRPGECNHHQLAGLTGHWEQGTVRGVLRDQGWGAALGHPAIALTETGDPVAVALFTSPDLPAHWARLDDFEGEGYQRVAVMVETSAGPVDAWIYALADGAAG